METTAFAKSAVAEKQTAPDQLAVRSQLERLLASPLFNQSRRYSSLLRYIVERALEENAEPIKERTVGVDVFGRSPSYDTNADPVVRTTAAQLRRRIAQYYFEAGHEHELVVELHPGGYMPVFRWPENASPGVVVPFIAPFPVEVPNSQSISALPRLGYRALTYRAIFAGLALISVATLLMLHPWHRQTALERFWQPVWDSSRSVLICVGEPRRPPAADQGQPAQNAAVAPEITIYESLRDNSIAWPDAITFSDIIGLMRANGRGYTLRKASATQFTDLKETPAVLVGGYNNEWIMRLGAPLRFSYQKDENRAYVHYIQDRRNPGKRDWSTDLRAPFSSFARDYGLITRELEPTTGKVLVIASGIASYGTIAAGDFLTDERLMEMVDKRAPAGWQKKNVQVVFSTSVVNGSAGAAQILDTYFW